jgi:hypothetical protein
MYFFSPPFCIQKFSNVFAGDVFGAMDSAQRVLGSFIRSTLPERQKFMSCSNMLRTVNCPRGFLVPNITPGAFRTFLIGDTA